MRWLIFAQAMGSMACNVSRPLEVVGAPDLSPPGLFPPDRFPPDLLLPDLSTTARDLASPPDLQLVQPLTLAFPSLTPYMGQRSGGFVTAGDFDNDGDLDLACAERALGDVTSYAGDGTGQFSLKASARTTCDSVPEGIATADVDGDGILDLVVIGQGVSSPQGTHSAPTVQVLKGNGDATFAETQCIELTLGGVLTSIVLADFNKDGLPDAVAGSYDGFAVFRGVRGVGLQLFSDHLPTTNYPAQMSTADFNLDGMLDFACADRFSDAVSIVLGNGDLTFQPWRDFTGGPGPAALVAGDYDRDGLVDVADAQTQVAGEGSGYVGVLLGRGDGTLASLQIVPGTPLTSARAWMGTADFDRDGALDLVYAGADAGEIVLVRGLGDGNFDQWRTFAGPTAWSGVIADFDRDGLPDLAFSDPSFTSVVLNRSH